jgi:hypothetical protein
MRGRLLVRHALAGRDVDVGRLQRARGRRRLALPRGQPFGIAPQDTPVEGVAPDGVFQKAICEQPCGDSVTAREAEVVAAAKRLIARHPDFGAIRFECTNFPPHRAAVEKAIGLPVYDVFTLIGVLRAGSGMPVVSGQSARA